MMKDIMVYQKETVKNISSDFCKISEQSRILNKRKCVKSSTMHSIEISIVDMWPIPVGLRPVGPAYDFIHKFLAPFFSSSI